MPLCKERLVAEHNVNATGFDYWNNDAGRQWVAQQGLIDALFTSATAAIIAEAAPRSADRVIDVGCGTGTTAFELADRVGRHGNVLGIDISTPMLTFARKRAEERTYGNVSFVEADATTYPFKKNSADLVFSRFGVMFFEEPVIAFANLRSGMTLTGRLAFVCFRQMVESPWYRMPIEAAKPHLPPLPPLAPDAPGMFTFARRERLEEILSEAGYRDIQMKPADVPINAGSVDRALAFMTHLGPINRMLGVGSDEQRQTAIAAVRDTLAANNRRQAVPKPHSTCLSRHRRRRHRHFQKVS
jgi:SAM-dependent methyltransferase